MWIFRALRIMICIGLQDNKWRDKVFLISNKIILNGYLQTHRRNLSTCTLHKANLKGQKCSQNA